MTQAKLVFIPAEHSLKKISRQFFMSFLFGLILPLSFAPFHFSGLALISLAFFYWQVTRTSTRHAFFLGLFFGLGYFGLGTSWVFISIRDYGHLGTLFAAFITLIFLLYLSFFPGIMAFVFKQLSPPPFTVKAGILFSALWVLGEFVRATFLTGFPWLLLGFGQFDMPYNTLFPLIGVFGVGLICCIAATLLTHSVSIELPKRIKTSTAFVILLLAPSLLQTVNWVKEIDHPLSVGIIQANLSMKDKWDERLFWKLMDHYQTEIEQLLGTNVIVMPESAIPLPASYVTDFLGDIHQKAKKANTAILLGIPQTRGTDESIYFNTLIGLGKAKGSYLKQHLVPFGEYIPKPLIYFSAQFGLLDANLKPGDTDQTLMRVQQYPVASLICYELAYNGLLRQQLPQGAWIVSLSDNGWFGHSLAMYQQQQMAQVSSLQTGRYQVVANNVGLSSLINTKGEIITSLAAFRTGVLKATLFPAEGTTPWVHFGDWPTLLFCLIIVLFCLYKRISKRKVNH